MGEKIYEIVKVCFQKHASKYIQTLVKKQTWTVLAGIVEENKKNGTFECISFATGTRSDELDEQGIRLHDSHGEVLARRAAVRYKAFFIYYSKLSRLAKLLFNLSSNSSIPLIVSSSTFLEFLKNRKTGVFRTFNLSAVSGFSLISTCANLTE